jgi:hypothetical protein
MTVAPGEKVQPIDSGQVTVFNQVVLTSRVVLLGVPPTFRDAPGEVMVSPIGWVMPDACTIRRFNSGQDNAKKMLKART